MDEENGESIYGCGKSQIAKPDYGRVTAKGNHVYFHLLKILSDRFRFWECRKTV